jgi:hypothetical protein
MITVPFWLALVAYIASHLAALGVGVAATVSADSFDQRMRRRAERIGWALMFVLAICATLFAHWLAQHT